VSSPATPASARRAELRARTALFVAALLVVLAVPLAMAGCGDEERSEARQAQEAPDGPVDISGTDPLGQEIGGSVAPLAMCTDWNGGSEPERLATIEEIRKQLAAQDSGVTAPELSDDEAEEVFDHACEPSWAAGFRLYKLYSRAVGFVNVEREPVQVKFT
jgi:hypothetical protein